MILSLAPTTADVSGFALCLSAGAYTMAALDPFRASSAMSAQRMLPLAWFLHAWALGMTLVDWSAPEPVARFGFAPSLSLTLWCVVGVYLFERLLTYNQRVLQVLAMLSIMGLVLSWFFPGQAHPQIQQNWAPFHWVLGFTSYGLIGAALMHAIFWQQTERRLRSADGLRSLPQQGMPLLRIENLTFKFVLAAFAALSLTLLLGFWHASPWRWDHKTVLSVMSWCVFASMLLGRQVLGWRGRTAIRWLYAGAFLLLLAYAGSRFVLEVILQRT
jgi:ABC-type uncharacterized transport system permease subunit